jgi:CO dehydrogenase maturation factor
VVNLLLSDNMTKILAVSGKGGVGKTTFSAMLLKYIAKNLSDDNDILVIDGDPASNIPEVIGLETELEKTVSYKTYRMKEKIDKGQVPQGYDKGLALESDIQSILYEEDDFDVLVMGRGEGKGCYCFINNLLKNIIDPLEESYDIILMDMPAGLEHFSRRTDKDVDDLIIVTDMSKMGFNTVERIVEIANEVHLDFDKYWVIGNRFNESAKHFLVERVEKIKEKFDVKLEIAGFIPMDDEIIKSNLESIPVLKISDENPAFQETLKIAEKIFG